MGAGIGPGFGNTFGSHIGGKVDKSGQTRVSTTAKLPKNDSQLMHIFSNKEGHMPDTTENREKISRVANNPKDYYGEDKYGNKWYAENQNDGSQIWVKVHGKTISDAGLNQIPRGWDSETGFNNNPKKNNKWRKKK